MAAATVSSPAACRWLGSRVAWPAAALLVGLVLAGPVALAAPRVVAVAHGLVNPWSLAFLPDGRLLVTERPGRMRIVNTDGKLGPPLPGLPPVVAEGQGGLLEIAPSGMAFLTRERYPGGKGQRFIGSLRAEALTRIELDGRNAVHQERLLKALNERIRDLRQGPDGYLYLLTDNPDGRVLRLLP